MRTDARTLATTLLALVLGACSTTYKPATLDPQTGLYQTRTTVDAGGVITAKTHVAPTDFAAVLVVAESNQYPPRLEFVVRRTLTELGYAKVLNIAEWRAWATDNKFEVPADKVTGQTLKDFSTQVKPLLIVHMRYAWLGGDQHFAGLAVVDARNLESLLTVNHPKTVWLTVDEEMIYPVLNEFRKWHRKMVAQSS
jgi:hypothetical protein